MSLYAELTADLKKRLPNLPLLLAGPILRKTTPTEVTVWVALKRAAEVTLTVYEAYPGGKREVVGGKRSAVQIGENLYVVAVTADKLKVEKLVPGQLYYYDLEFKGSDNGSDFSQNLVEASQPRGAFDPTNIFAYKSLALSLPSFALPPEALDDLRIAHGSCRKPHGVGTDALPILDAMIRETAQYPRPDRSQVEPRTRPHMLLLTGDQIYADDVARPLLAMLTAAGDVLLGWRELLPEVGPEVVNSYRKNHRAEDLLPGKRADVAGENGAGLTSGAASSHLFSLGEYLAMHLFVWSDVLWPPELPGFEDMTEGMQPKERDRFQWQYLTEIIAIESFRGGLTDVRRALANVPTYMIMDDHEVSDDWYTCRDWCERVMGNPFGRRIVENAMTAYALCQAWGNTPEQFVDIPSDPPPGKRILDRIPYIGSPLGDKFRDEIAPILSVHTYEDMLKKGNAQSGRGGSYHEKGALDYHYAISGPQFVIWVTDTRTWRRFPSPASKGHAEFLDHTAIDGQLKGMPLPPIGGALMVLMTTNPIPIQGFQILEQAKPTDYQYEFFDGWKLGSADFERMLVYILSRTSKLYPQDGIGRVVFLTGDVHFSFAARLQYWGDRPFSAASLGLPNKLLKGCVAQLCVSAFKNAEDMTIGLHHQGLAYAPIKITVALHRWYQIWDEIRNGQKFHGWNVGSNGSPAISPGVFRYENNQTTRLRPLINNPSVVEDGRIAAFAWSLAGKIKGTIEVTTESDWQYFLDFPAGEASGRENALLNVPLNLSQTPESDFESAHSTKELAAYERGAISAREMTFRRQAGHQFVGISNIGDMGFEWRKGSERKVRNTLWWRLVDGNDGEENTEAFPLTTFVVSLELDDSKRPTVHKAV